jgi:Antirestriction protein
MNSTSFSSLDQDTPQIYVACLRSYNNGSLYGTWIDATQDPEDIMQEIQAMLKASPESEAEEFAIHDYANFEGIRFNCHQRIEHIHEIACFIAEHGSLGVELLNNFHGDIEDAQEAMEHCYLGEWDSLADYARHLMEDSGELDAISDNMSRYIDFEAMANDMELSGDVYTIEAEFGGVHVFSAC